MKEVYTTTIILAVIALGLGIGGTETMKGKNIEEKETENIDFSAQVIKIANGEAKTKDGYGVATFAGGCFWCSEASFEEYEGVHEVYSGYSGGEETNPTYEQVASGKTGHREAVQIIYDKEKINYKELLHIYWRHIDPTDAGGSFVDRGFQYSSAIFYHTEKQKQLAEQSREELKNTGKIDGEIATKILPFKNFYIAEEEHQDYSKKRTLNYKLYRKGSGRDQYIEKTWGEEQINKESPAQGTPTTEGAKEKYSEAIAKLTPLQYKVTQEDGTERAFKNEYWNNTKEGIYVDIVSGEPLFSSTHKYKSGTGWPSFTEPLEKENIILKEDKRLFLGTRTEVRSKNADSHLGHVFPDGPQDRGGLRYCMNSAAMKFVAKEELEKEGYGEYLKLFE